MINALRLSALLALLPSLVQAQRPVSAMLVNGVWFDGTRFIPDTLWVSGGRIRVQPQPYDTTMDLAGGFVVPAAGDAHQHRFGTDASRREDGPRFVQDGVFYVMVQDLLAAGPQASEPSLDVPDMVWTRMPLLDPAGSLVSFLDRLVAGGEFPGLPAGSTADGRAYAAARTTDELDRHWDALLEANPAFLKVILGYGEDRPRRLAPAFLAAPERGMARPGFNPELLPGLVARAHRSGRRVSAHVETAEDFRHAVAAGVDMIAHLPGWHVGPTAGFQDRSLDHWLIPDSVIASAAARQIPVITTTWPKPFLDQVAHGADFRQVQRNNLERLARAGVPLAIGADAEGTAVDEAQHLRLLGLDNLTILRALVNTTPRLIFPDRRVGCLEDGCEADLLVLRHNPLIDLVNLRTFALKMRGGVLLPATTAVSFSAVSQVGAVTLLRANQGSLFDNVVLFSGPDGVLLVDAALEESGDSLRAAVLRLTGRQPSTVVNTHFHHAGGNRAFGAARIVAHRATAARMRVTSRMYGVAPIGPWPAGALPDSTIGEGTSFRFNGETVELIHLPNAHTDGDLVVIFRGSGVVATGDIFAPLLNPCDFANGCLWSSYVKAIDRLVGLVPGDAVVFPGHGPASTRAELEEFRNLLNEVTLRVTTRIQEGWPRNRIVAEGLPARFADWAARGIPSEFFLGNAYDAMLAERGGGAQGGSW